MKGFTLIELIVTVSIIVIITVGALANYFVFDSKQKTLNEARDLVSILNKARSSAQTLEYPPGCTRLNSYQVSEGDSEGYIKITAVCASGNIDIEEKKVLQFTSASQAIALDFLAQTGFLDGGEEVQIVLTNKETSGLSRTITVDPLIVDNISISSE